MTYFINEIFHDEYGRFEIQSEVKENGLTFQWRKYCKSIRTKTLGGMYANYCDDTNTIKFYRNEYIRNRAYPKFIEACSKGSV